MSTGSDHPAEPVLPVGRPPSLRQRGPVRLELTDRGGRCLRMTRSGVRLTAGQILRVKVTVPAVDGTTVEVTADESLQTVLAVCPTPHGGGVAYHADFRGQLRSALPQFIRDKFPLPCRGELVVGVKDALDEPIRMVIPVLVGPGWKTLAVTGLLVAVLFYLLPTVSAHLGPKGDVFAALKAVVTDPTPVAWALGIAAATTAGLRLLGSALVFSGLVGGEE